MKNKYTESYIKRKTAAGWKRRFMFGPPEIIEEVVNYYKQKMLEYKLVQLRKRIRQDPEDFVKGTEQ